MIYNNYQVLVDRINELLKENRELKDMIHVIPLSMIIKMLSKSDLSIEAKRRWYKLYEEKHKYLQRIAKRE